MKNFNDIEIMLKKYDQEHILKFYNDLNNEQKVKFINQIQNTSFKKMELLYKNSMVDEKINLNQISPMKYVDKENLSNAQKEKYSKIGIDAINKNELAVVTLAGRVGKQTSEYRDQREFIN